VATEPIRAGRRVMATTAAVMVDDKAFRGLRRDDLAVLLGQAIVALPKDHSGRFLNLSGSESPEETQLDRVYKIFTTNAFRTPILGSTLGEGGDKEKSSGPDPEVNFQSTFTEGNNPLSYFKSLSVSVCVSDR